MPTTEPISIPWCLILHLYETWNLNETQFAILMFVGIALCIACAYFIGSISPSIIISNRMLHDDVRKHGSGNAGATNMLRNYGAKFAVLTLFLDMLKAAVAMGIGYLIYQKDGAAIAGLFAVIGHMFPAYYRFHGGKGVACATAVALLMLHPVAFLILLVCYMAILFMTKYVSLASIMSVLLFPMVQHAFHPEEGTAFLCALVIAVFVVFMHRENIKRLYEGQESKIDFSKFRRKKKTTDSDADVTQDGEEHE
ncbi:MAG: glycerol-3-phosphate 1-O-acyltransferase PlsY [Clostridia bacterium]|nr:glycerol-3-phosphate 1-O-acyltransferase PlsY [Clostridia bacterium]